MNAPNNEEKQSEKRMVAKRHLGPFFVLLVLAPTVAELLLGDVPLNASLPFLMVLNLSYYGTGALIVREIVHRRGLSWAWIPILAFTYGLIEEGLVLHSLFNPNFPGVGNLGFYGRTLGVDWVWATFVLGLHTVWSLPVPILVIELLFPRYRKERWIGNVGFTVCCVAFVLAMVFLAYIFASLSATRVIPSFAPSPIALIVTAILALAILLFALFIPVQPAATTASQTPSRNAPCPWLVGAFAFLMGGLFLGTEEVFRSWALPAPFAFLVYLVLAIVAVVIIRLWSASDRRWQDTHRVALAFGALLDYCLFGFIVTRSDIVNQAFHGVLALITIVLMVWLTSRVRARVLASSQAMEDQMEICTFPTMFHRKRAHRRTSQPQEIAPGVYCLEVGKGIMRSNVYFVRSGSSWALIDTASAKCDLLIQEAAESLFGANIPPTVILLTHDHPDHAGSTRELARRWGCLVYVHPDELELCTMGISTYLFTVKKYANPLDRWVILPLLRLLPKRARASMLAESSFKDAVRAFDPGAGVPSLPGWECIPTPGHTRGHVSFFRPCDRVLITGDAVLTVHLNSFWSLLLWGVGRTKQRLSGPPWYTTWSWQAAKKSVASLVGLEPRVLACGHGLPMSGSGTAPQLRAFAEHFR